jgi:hypothetical protein
MNPMIKRIDTCEARATAVVTGAIKEVMALATTGDRARSPASGESAKFPDLVILSFCSYGRYIPRMALDTYITRYCYFVQAKKIENI